MVVVTVLYLQEKPVREKLFLSNWDYVVSAVDTELPLIIVLYPLDEYEVHSIGAENSPFLPALMVYSSLQGNGYMFDWAHTINVFWELSSFRRVDIFSSFSGKARLRLSTSISNREIHSNIDSSFA